MKLKSITFRCSVAQLNRLRHLMETELTTTRTDLLSAALEEFLDFVEGHDTRHLDLFSLVQQVDRTGEGVPFSEQA